ncbi:MAG: hypothetical protein C5B60_09255 [Chloroflexi bacterium]|nr:MAG: hypothetical protein C5B60_09255 [Chloroflexota bacterium]
MTRFRLIGHFRGRLVHIAWEDGRLYGDPELVQIIKQVAAGFEGVLISALPWLSSVTNHLESPWRMRAHSDVSAGTRAY